MQNILIISGHPDLKNSVATAAILDELAESLPQAEIRKLDALHQNYEFDIQAEQAAVLRADVIVWQVPFYWYAMPALMKKWLDDVFHHGFAHGSEARIGGKKLLVSVTTGAPAELYRKDGFFRHEMEEYMIGFETAAALCGLDYRGAMWLNGVSYVGRDQAKTQEQQAMARDYARRLAEKIKSL
ncbi:flavodoxin family protein [Actinobacillus succinogenes]|uniref:NAD(P)H dehydrogenase (Quinone) n=1 Tax=Actinobacillus succinogenes (strain ATCC 55618 / DSM 22257 / CCUG 43843 / 130Z) TaxID=339671 RepID=A6VPJ2_ACTSZ|nr:NAD(P)H-dependent oxidoreductase [Actinobacillus succinogenes]ABR74889.1 NAD(P)H dehydrogenase (quinone) [Actinobacillus succinogenes 130Z]PHI40701.1 flavodoxin family protein [Actinobacillus succinogenes]